MTGHSIPEEDPHEHRTFLGELAHKFEVKVEETASHIIMHFLKLGMAIMEKIANKPPEKSHEEYNGVLTLVCFLCIFFLILNTFLFRWIVF